MLGIIFNAQLNLSTKQLPLWSLNMHILSNQNEVFPSSRA